MGKIKGARKVVPKRFDAEIVNGPPGPVSGWATEYNRRARSMVYNIDAVARLCGIGLGEGGAPRKAAKELEKLTAFNTQEGYAIEKNLCLMNTILRRLVIVLNDRDTSCYFLCSDFNGRRIRRSQIYCTRSVAMNKFDRDPSNLTGITWIVLKEEPPRK